MRFDNLLATLSPGLIAPLALMATGLLLTLGGVAFLLWRRRGRKNSVAKRGNETQNTPDLRDDREVEAGGEAEVEAGVNAHEIDAHKDASASSAPVAKPAGRRRSLIGGAERDDGTPPAGQNGDDPDPDQTEDPGAFEPVIEPAEFSELSEDGSEIETEADHGPFDEVEDVELEASSPDDDAIDEGLDNAGEIEPAIAAAAVIGAGATAASLQSPLEGDESAKPGEETPVDPEIAAARRTPIVFRQFLPQSPGKDGLSFYGGQPIGPADFQWPRERGAQGGAPLQFLMQWDCAQLADQDPTGLLPQEGVLYCFVNCDRDDEEDFLASHAFVHCRGSVRAWQPIEIPSDAGPALGKTAALQMSGCTDQIPDAEDYAPRLMPRFPFAPMALRYPAMDDTSDQQDAQYWSDEKAAPALLEVQKTGVAVKANPQDLAAVEQSLERPFQAFPHDFGAIRVIAARMIEVLQNPDAMVVESLYPDLSDEKRTAQFASWIDEAKELYLLGIQRPEGQKLEQNISDDIWQWFEGRKAMLGSNIPAIVEESVDLSLSVSSEALGAIPAEWIDKAMDTHALAVEYMADHANNDTPQIRASTPARMFGLPSHADGLVEEVASDHILLLELPSGAGPQHHFNGKVLQYWITPDDLAAGRFENVQSLVING